MSNVPSKEDVVKSIEVRSDQLNADDLLTGPITVTITGVRKGDREQPIVVEIEGHRPYKPCKTMRRVLIGTFSDDPKCWVGQKMTLYCDPDVMWAGVKVGGIRISHLSGLDNPRTFMLTQTRGKKAEVTIKPIPNGQPTNGQRKGTKEIAETIRGLLDEAETEAEIDKHEQYAMTFDWPAKTAEWLAKAVAWRREQIQAT